MGLGGRCPVGREPRTRILGAGRRPPRQLGSRGVGAAEAERARSWRGRARRMEGGRVGGAGREARERVGAGKNSAAPRRAGKRRPGRGAEGEGEGPCLPTSPPRPPGRHSVRPLNPRPCRGWGGVGVGDKNPGPLSRDPRLGEPAPPSPLPFWPGLSIPPNSHAGKRAAPRPSLLFT